MMPEIDWARTAEALIWSIIAGGALALYIQVVGWVGQALYDADVEQQDRARRRERLERITAIADQVEAAPEHERQRLYREAEALGFLDNDDEQRKVS